MKKKLLIIVPIVAGVILLILLIMNQVWYVQTNSSRRDGQVVAGAGDADADLEGLNGELDENYQAQLESSHDAEAALQREQDDSALLSSLQSIGPTEPVSQNVDSVEVVLLPEAIMMGDGDAGAFYGNEEFEDVIPVDINSFSAEDIPTKYDSRNVDGQNYVTPVEDQGYTYFKERSGSF